MSLPVRLSLGNLAEAGELVLAQFAGQLETILGAGNVPSRRYVAFGSGAQSIAWDGPELNVAFAGIHQGQPGSSYDGTQNPAGAVVAGMWVVLLLRKIPALSSGGSRRTAAQMIPTAEKLDQAGQQNLEDVAALTRAFLVLHGTYVFNNPGTGMGLDSCVPVGPEGGLAGARLIFTSSLT